MDPSLIGAGVLATVVVVVLWRFFNWTWFNPKRMEKCLKDQGVKGTPYKFLYGDIKELVRMIGEANKKPISLNDDITARVVPLPRHYVATLGKSCFTWAGPRPILHITDPTMIREVLAKYEIFQKPKGGNPLVKSLIKGLSDAEGEKWAKHRKIINPAFHAEKLKHMVPAFSVSCQEMVNKWEESFKGKDSSEIDVWPHLQTMASDVISRTAFSSSYEKGRKIFELQMEQSKQILPLARSIYIPGSQYLPTKRNKKMKAIVEEVKGLVRGIIDERMLEMKQAKKSKDDLLGILLDSNLKEIARHGNSKSALSVDDIIEECKVFYFAGQETTAVLLTWTMVLLAKHRDWQDRAREEVLKVFGDSKPDVDGLSQLKVLNMIFLEVLRLYPPVVSLIRAAQKEVTVGNIKLPKGTFVQLHVMLSHYDPCIWGDDVKEFKPERFAEGASKVNKGSQTGYFPFGGGPRVCIGQNFSLMESKIVMATILSRYSFELSPSYSHAPYTIITLQPQFGAHLVLHKNLSG